MVAACSAPIAPTSEPPTGGQTTLATTSSSSLAPSAPPTSTTAPSPEDLTLMVIGDWGAGTTATDSIANALHTAYLSNPYDTIVTTGDNYYKDDTATLFAPFAWTVGSNIEWWASWGNHDVDSAARGAGIAATLGPTPFWVKHQWGPLDVIILDSNQIGSTEQLSFLATALASDRPAIVVFHHPAYSCSKHGSTPEVVESWIPLIAGDGDVLLVLNGHDHNYQHFNAAGVDYVVTGGGGRNVYDLKTCPKGHPELISGFKAHHFLRLDLEGIDLTVTAIDETGAILDDFAIAVP